MVFDKIQLFHYWLFLYLDVSGHWPMAQVAKEKKKKVNF
jgi:hypothetical protein